LGSSVVPSRLARGDSLGSSQSSAALLKRSQRRELAEVGEVKLQRGEAVARWEAAQLGDVGRRSGAAGTWGLTGSCMVRPHSM
jgi:hypothetical protein